MFIKSYNLSILIAIPLILVLTSCVKPLRYNIMEKLPTLHHEIQHEKKEHYIESIYHVFSPEDSQKYLASNLLDIGYQPIYLSIFNKTSKYLHFDKNSFSEPIILPHEVMGALHEDNKKNEHFISSFFFGDDGDNLSAELILAIEYKDKALLTKNDDGKKIDPFSKISGMVFVPKEKFSPHFSLNLVDMDSNKLYSVGIKNPKCTLN